MEWDNDNDMKEYRPRRRNDWPRVDYSVANFCNPVPFPGGVVVNQGQMYAGQAVESGAGTMMSTAEILDFSDGADS